jgi:hypothetical protein
MRSRRKLLLVLSVLVLGLALGQVLPDRGIGSALGVSPARAGGFGLPLPDGVAFVTSDGPNAYLWQREGDRLVLLGQAARTTNGEAEQATFVWMPGVEQRTFARP